MMPRKAETWGETFNRYLRAGHDHGSAAYAADENEARRRRGVPADHGAAVGPKGLPSAQAPDEPNPDPAGGVLIQHGMNQKPTEGA